ncbi:unnamed protein product [Moneuplotes crassus]|uniref:Uncharacterized protein n=1 Tax=Euplotes crassus TaxID=5936 RepID=A0AAD1XN43_EUPCR|nr:unnamed protein product [Moneuplotes crassus]
MKEKGVNQNILNDLKQDYGFIRFCTEWIAQLLEIPKPNTKRTSLNNIASLKDRIKSLNTKPTKELKSKELKIESKCKSLNLCLLYQKESLIYKSSPPYLSFKEDLVLDLKTPDNILFCKTIREHNNFPEAYSVEIECNRRSIIMNKFLKTSFPVQARELLFRNSDINLAEARKMSINKYFRQFSQILHKVTTLVYLSYFDISMKKLRKIFSCCRDKLRLEFSACKLHVETAPDLCRPLSQCTIQMLSFYNCGGPQCSDWAQNPEELDNLILGISKSESLFKSLKDLILIDSNIPGTELGEIFQKHGISMNIVRLFKEQV